MEGGWVEVLLARVDVMGLPAGVDTGVAVTLGLVEEGMEKLWEVGGTREGWEVELEGEDRLEGLVTGALGSLVLGDFFEGLSAAEVERTRERRTRRVSSATSGRLLISEIEREERAVETVR